MYKDKDKQREADRERQRRHRAKKSVTEQSVTGGTSVTPKMTAFERRHYKPAAELRPGEFNPVSKPGDSDYVPQCETTKAFVEGKAAITKAERHIDASDIGAVRALHKAIHKRGRDIQTFDDLPADVQQTIRTVSDTNEEFQRRTGIAIRYQHVFPERYTP